MAELLSAAGWAKAGSVGSYLRETLPDSYVVVADPRIYGHQVAAAVVGHCGLLIIQAADAPKVIGEHVDASEVDSEHADAPVLSEAKMREAVARFLADEFPQLNPPVRLLQAVRDWSSELTSWRILEPSTWLDESLAETVLKADCGTADPGEYSAFPDDAARRDLGMGLRDRQLTATQTATKPFVFRSGGTFRTGVSALTLREAVAHMDRYPDDGIQHLRDGTLAEWLEEEGALNLAALARNVVRQPRVAPRVSLENFLLGTGLVARPQLLPQPDHVNLGFIVQGQKTSQRLMLNQGRGRGCLFGEISGGDPWLRVEPRTFDRAPVEVIVTAETAGLKIRRKSYRSNVVIKSSAGAEPANIPVSLRLVAEPPKLVRVVLRPLFGFLPGTLLGALIGLQWLSTGLIGGDGAGLWPLLLAVIVGLAGGWRGLRQPPAWPARYALLRWLVRTLAWSAGFGVLGALMVQAWRSGLGGGLPMDVTLPAAIAGGAAFGFVPATLDEIAQSGHSRNQEYVHGRRSYRRRAALISGAVLLLLVALLAPRVIETAMRRAEIQAALRPALAWVETRFEELGDSMDRLIDQAQLRYYNQPAGATTEPQKPLIKLPKALGGS